MKKFAILAAAAAAALLPAAASAGTIITFDTNAVGSGHAAYAPGYTQYNAGNSAPASVAGVTFSGTAGVDNGAFGFQGTSSQTAFLQTYAGLQDGSFSLTGLGLVANKDYTLSFLDVLRNVGFSFDVFQGASLISSFTPASAVALGAQSVKFTSNGDDLTFIAVNGGGVDASAAIDNISVSAVPETATWAMMIAGFGMIGFATRRRAKHSMRLNHA